MTDDYRGGAAENARHEREAMDRIKASGSSIDWEDEYRYLYESAVNVAATGCENPESPCTGFDLCPACLIGVVLFTTPEPPPLADCEMCAGRGTIAAVSGGPTDCVFCGGSGVVTDVIGERASETSREESDFFTYAGVEAIDAAYRKGWNDALAQSHAEHKQLLEWDPDA